jgi:hypothetical protein
MSDVDRTIASLRVVAGGILASVAATAGIALFARDSLLPPAQAPLLVNGLILAVVAAGVAGVAGHAVIRRQAMAELRGRAAELRGAGDPTAAVAPAYRRVVILRAALTESPAVLAALAYLAGGPAWLMAVPAAAAFLLAVTMPTRAGLERFVEEALRA